MGEANLLEQLDLTAPANAQARRRPLPNAVNGEHGRLVEWRTVEGTGGVREVVLAKEDLRRLHAESLLDQPFDPELIGEPGDHGLAEDLMGAGEELEARDQQALELHEWLFEEDHVVEVGSARLAHPQAEIDRMLRELIIVLLAREPLLLGCRDQPAVAEECRRRVVEVARDTENVH